MLPGEQYLLLALGWKVAEVQLLYHALHQSIRIWPEVSSI